MQPLHLGGELPQGNDRRVVIPSSPPCRLSCAERQHNSSTTAAADTTSSVFHLRPRARRCPSPLCSIPPNPDRTTGIAFFQRDVVWSHPTPKARKQQQQQQQQQQQRDPFRFRPTVDAQASRQQRQQKEEGCSFRGCWCGRHDKQQQRAACRGQQQHRKRLCRYTQKDFLSSHAQAAERSLQVRG